MGRIRKDKGIEDFIALAQKLSKDDRFSLVLMGSMDSSDQHIKDIVAKTMASFHPTKQLFKSIPDLPDAK